MRSAWQIGTCTPSWTRAVKIDLGRWPAIHDYVGRVAARPTVRHALQEEGLS